MLLWKRFELFRIRTHLYLCPPRVPRVYPTLVLNSVAKVLGPKIGMPMNYPANLT